MLVLAQFNKNLGGVYVTEFKRMFINSCINWENSTLAVTCISVRTVMGGATSPAAAAAAAADSHISCCW